MKQTLILSMMLLGLSGCEPADDPETLASDDPIEQMLYTMGIAGFEGLSALGRPGGSTNGLGRSGSANGLGLPAGAAPSAVQNSSGGSGAANCQQACDVLLNCGLDTSVGNCIRGCQEQLSENGAEGQRLLNCIVTNGCGGLETCNPRNRDDLERDDDTPSSGSARPSRTSPEPT